MLFERQVSFHSRIAYHYESLAGFIFGFFSGMVLSFLPVVARRLGATGAQMALISSSFAFGLLLTFLWTYITMYGRKMAVFYWPKFVARSLFFLMPFVNTPSFFVAIVVFYYLLDSIGNPVYGAIMKEAYPEEERAKIMGYVRIVLNLGTMTAAFAGGRLLDWWGEDSYRIVFPVGAILGLISLSAFIHIPLREKNNTYPSLSFLQIIKEWFNDKTIWKLGGIISVAGFGNLLLGPLAPIFLVDKMKVSLSFVGLMGATSSIAIMLSYYFWGNFIDRKGPIPSLRIIFLIISIPPVMYIIGRNWSVLLAAVFSSFAGGGWELSWFKYVCARTNSIEKVQIDTGFYYNLMGIRGAIAPFVAVWLMNLFGLKITFFISFLIILWGFVLIWIFGKSLEPECATQGAV